MNSNGGDPLILNQDSSIIFSFGPDGNLKAINGQMQLQQLLIVAFEATNLAQEMRARLAMASMQQASEIADIRDKLAKERR